MRLRRTRLRIRVHHAAIRNWFSRNQQTGLGHLPDHRERLCACPVQPQALPSPIGVETARSVLLGATRDETATTS